MKPDAPNGLRGGKLVTLYGKLGKLVTLYASLVQIKCYAEKREPRFRRNIRDFTIILHVAVVALHPATNHKDGWRGFFVFPSYPDPKNRLKITIALRAGVAQSQRDAMVES